jgi:hypothetical protein
MLAQLNLDASFLLFGQKGKLILKENNFNNGVG